MILEFMLYTVSLSALIGVVAVATERLAIVTNRPRRWVWLLALLASLLLSFSRVGTNDPSIQPLAAVDADGQSGRLLDESATKGAVISEISREVSERFRGIDSILEALWLMGSCGVVAFYGFVYGRIRYASKRWSRSVVDGHSVLVASHTGPAVLGFLAPEVVIPRSLLTAPGGVRRVALEHESQHVATGDQLVMLLAIGLVAVMPWNPLLWWKFRRLRLAVELDCDARVVNRGVGVTEYGEALLFVVGQRQRHVSRALLSAASDPRQLELRIRSLVAAGATGVQKALVTAVWLASSLCVVAIGAEMPAPTSIADEPSEPEQPKEPKHPSEPERQGHVETAEELPRSGACSVAKCPELARRGAAQEKEGVQRMASGMQRQLQGESAQSHGEERHEFGEHAQTRGELLFPNTHPDAQSQADIEERNKEQLKLNAEAARQNVEAARQRTRQAMDKHETNSQ